MTQEQEELTMQNNFLLHQLLDEVKELKTQLAKPETDTCSTKEALHILGLGNQRYLTYFCSKEIALLDRRPGAGGFVYYKSQLKDLADKIRLKSVIVPPIKAIYDK